MLSDAVVAAIIMGFFGLIGIVLTYFLTTKSKTKNIKIGNGDAEATDTFYRLEWEKILSKAKHDVFVSSAALYILANGANVIMQWVEDKSHTLRLVSLNNSLFPKYFEIHHARCQVTDEVSDLHNNKGMFNDLFRELISNHSNIIEKEINKIMFCAFVAIDCGIDTQSYETSTSSHIIAFFYLPSKLVDKMVMKVTAISGTALFDALKEEIQAIWQDAEETDRSKKTPPTN